MTRFHRRSFLAGMFLLGAAAGAVENVSLVPDSVSYFERTFGVRGQVTAWFLTAGSSTLRYTFPGKGDVSFRLTETAPGVRQVDQVQVEPEGPALSMPQAAGYARIVVNGLTRAGMTCAAGRDDQDGMNSFHVDTCTEKANPNATPLEVTVTVQSLGGRNVVFAKILPKKY